MTEKSEYYLNYIGPNLTSCTFDEKDFTDKAVENYGPMNNWCGMLYTYKQFLEKTLREGNLDLISREMMDEHIGFMDG